MIRDGDGYRAFRHFFLHDDMASASSNFTKPCRATIAQTSLPERTCSLPSGNLHLGCVYVAAESLLYLFGRCAFEKQLHRLPKIVPGLFNTIALAGNIQLRYKRRFFSLLERC